MKRDRNLLRLILLRVRDGVAAIELSNYPLDTMHYHSALLVEDNYVDGSIVQDGITGRKMGSQMRDLTGKGHDFLEELEREHAQTQSKPSLDKAATKQISVFISHSDKDTVVADELIKVLRAALNIPREKIRCTGVIGYKLPAGADTDDILREEIHGSDVLIGLISPNSVVSTYVLFELGARWGAGLSLFPVLVAGKSELLRGPLGGKNALKCSSRGEMLQLIDDVGRELSLTPGGAHTYDREVDALVKAATDAAFREEVLTAEPVQTTASCLSKDAEELLKDARHGDGRIALEYTRGGLMVIINGKNIGTIERGRGEAMFKGLLKELTAGEFLEDETGQGKVYVVTAAGYEYTLSV